MGLKQETEARLRRQAEQLALHRKVEALRRERERLHRIKGRPAEEQPTGRE